MPPSATHAVLTRTNPRHGGVNPTHPPPLSPVSSHGVFLSIIIPAHNEERHIGATIDAARRAAREASRCFAERVSSDDAPSGLEHEIIVALDACTDASESIARARGCIVVSHDRRQISATRNLGARIARGDAFLFVDADTIVPAPALRQAAEALEHGCVGGGAPVKFDGHVPLYAELCLTLLTVSFRAARLTGGAFFFCRRDAFLRAGGWDESLFASEEITLAKALQKLGEFHIIRHPVITSGRKLRTHSAGEVVSLLIRGVKSRLFDDNRMLRSREGLELWYAPRRDDPHVPGT